MRPTAWAMLLGSVLMLGCGGLSGQVTEANVRLTGLPQFVCPTSTPRPTSTQYPTATHPDIQYPASGWVTTYTQNCYWVWTGYTYVQSCQWVPSGGYYSTPAYSVPAATSTPRPTHTPYPTPTPYIVTQDYAMGQDVIVGERDGLYLRLKVSDPQRVVIDDELQVVTWTVTVRNIGNLPYHTLPGAQVFVAGIDAQSGYWYTSQEAAQAAGLTLEPTALDILIVEPGQRHTVKLAAFTPIGELTAIGWLLDPYSGGAGHGVVGGNTAIWLNRPDPNGCTGNLDELAEFIPTPARDLPTPTPSVTPFIPAYTGATRQP